MKTAQTDAGRGRTDGACGMLRSADGEERKVCARSRTHTHHFIVALITTSHLTPLCPLCPLCTLPSRMPDQQLLSLRHPSRLAP